MKKESSKKLVAVAGQPNSGKSTIFNILTGARQHVANYPGVTVEKKTGSYHLKGDSIELVDLPGTYSLTSYTQEERIARDFLLNEKPAVVVDVVDASNLERNLYLTFQLAEMDIPLVINLNMMDVAEKRGMNIDAEKLGQQLGASVVPTVGNRGKGKNELKEAVRATSKEGQSNQFRLDYGEALETHLMSLEEILSDDKTLSGRYPLRWLAVKLMENDTEAQRLVKENSSDGNKILNFAEEKRKSYISTQKKPPEKAIAQLRYQAAQNIAEASVTRKKEIKRSLTDRFDQIACNRFLGPIILVATIYLIYELAIVQGYNITPYTWPFLAGFRDFIASILPSEGFIFDPFFRSMPLWVVNGTIAVLNYIPIFLILFALIAILEDTGYMARMAFILDRVFRYFGLHGQSVLPMVIGGLYVGGCAIPGVLATRGMKDEKARMATIMIVPLMNCLAKIPFYVLMIGQADQAQQTFLKRIGKDNPYAPLFASDKLMEFAQYWGDYKKAKMGAKGKEAKEVVDQGFRKKNFEFFKIVKKGKYKSEGKVIKDKYAKKVYTAYKKLDKKRNKLRREDREETIVGSYMGRAGRFIEPFTRWAGFNWRVNIALMSSFAAKESSVATLGGIYQSPPGEKEGALEERMREKEVGWTALHVLAIMLFMAMYPPCIPTLLMVRLETGSTKWMLFATFYPIVLGLIISILVFTGGSLLGLSGMQAMITFYVLALIFLVLMGFIKREPELT
ncbi:MAG: ferrous iron transport protein B [Desulfobacterium sp. 4572_20]|nr:MAG: ferrous iron transport protein B [Desulfobacterium sp. 4572_20]